MRGEGRRETHILPRLRVHHQQLGTVEDGGRPAAALGGLVAVVRVGDCAVGGTSAHIPHPASHIPPSSILRPHLGPHPSPKKTERGGGERGKGHSRIPALPRLVVGRRAAPAPAATVVVGEDADGPPGDGVFVARLAVLEEWC